VGKKPSSKKIAQDLDVIAGSGKKEEERPQFKGRSIGQQKKGTKEEGVRKNLPSVEGGYYFG